MQKDLKLLRNPLANNGRLARLQCFAILPVCSSQRNAFICHWQRRHASSRHAPRAFGFSFIIAKEKTAPFGTVFSLAGAEGLEPSARGFGGLGSSLKNKGLQAFYDTLTTPTVIPSNQHTINVNYLIDIGKKWC